MPRVFEGMRILKTAPTGSHITEPYPLRAVMQCGKFAKAWIDVDGVEKIAMLRWILAVDNKTALSPSEITEHLANGGKAFIQLALRGDYTEYNARVRLT